MDSNSDELISLLESPAQTQTDLWHPKLTPYRFLVLATTIGLGSAKAYAVSKNQFFVATSIEWVTAVVIFSILFILGLLELDPPHFLKCLLEPDLIHILFQKLSWTPPEYRSDEIVVKKRKFPPVTGYRLLTSALVALFGISKAYFTYKDNSPAADGSEWFFGIIITSFLYILGLYEKNPVQLMPFLFSDNNPAAVVSSTLWLIRRIIGISICLLVFRFLWPIASGWPSSYILDSFHNFGRYLLVLAGLLVLPFPLFDLSFPLVQACGLQALICTRFPIVKWICNLSRLPFATGIRSHGQAFFFFLVSSIVFGGLLCISFDSMLGLGDVVDTKFIFSIVGFSLFEYGFIVSFGLCLFFLMVVVRS